MDDARSMITNATSGSVSAVKDAVNKTESDTTNAIDQTESDAKNEVNKLESAVHISDFYSFHMLNYCNGSFEENSKKKDIKTMKCSKQKAFFYPSEMLDDTLSLPEFVRSTMEKTQRATQAMTVFYCIAVSTTFIALFGAWWNASFEEDERVSILIYSSSAVSATSSIADFYQLY